MKKLSIILIIVATTAIVFSSCKKYEEGPAVSLTTVTTRITGNWRLQEVTVDGQIQDLSSYEVIRYEFLRDGTGKISKNVLGAQYFYDLEWQFDNSKENLMIRVKEGDNFGDWQTIKILRLTDSDLWLTEVSSTIEKYTKE